MDSKTFKTIIKEFFLSKGFSKSGNMYFKSFNELRIITSLQKSNYSNSFYINLGYIINNLNEKSDNYRDVDGDVRARFSIKKSEVVDSYNVETISRDELLDSLESNYEKYIKEINSIESLRLLLKRNPVLIYQTKMTARKILEI
jgi:hypothetical protein